MESGPQPTPEDAEVAGPEAEEQVEQAESEEPAREPAETAEGETPPEPPPAAASSAGGSWEPPLRFSDHFSALSVRAIKALLVCLAALISLLFSLWVVPGVAVATSDDYAVFKARVERDPMLRTYLGGRITCQWVPFRYDLDAEGGPRFSAVATGLGSRAVVEGQVRDGKVVRYHQRLAVDWTRPLLETVGPRRP